MTEAANPSRRTAAYCVLLVAAVLVVFWQVGRFDFTNYDDPDYASNNRFVQMGLTAESVQWAFHNSFAWHPVTWLSHMLDNQVFGVNAGAHHWVNLLFHLANTLLLFLALRRMTGAEGRSAFVAALFALHPLHVESVAWVAERKDVLSGFFWMLTLLAYAAYVERRGGRRYLLVTLCFALGLMAKPMVVTLPFVLLLLDYWPLGRLKLAGSAAAPTGPARAPAAFPPNSLVRLVGEKLPWLVLSVAASTVTYLYLRGWGRLNMEMYSLPVRLANALVSYVRYLGKAFVPEDLSVVYPHPGLWPWWTVAGAGLVLALLTWGTFVARRRFPYLLVGWLWFLGTLVPVLGLVQMNPQAMADRYTYLPLVGLFIAVTWGAHAWAERWACPKPVLVGTAVVVLLGCAWGSLRQLQYWQNSVTLFSRAVDVTTNNAIARYNLGQALSMQGQALEARGQLPEAMEWFKKSLPHYEEAVRINPRYDEAHNNLGLTLAKLGRFPEATNCYATALQINPRNDTAHFNYAVALTHLGQTERAIRHFETALELEPQNAFVHFRLAVAYEAQGRADDALRHFREAVRLRASFAEAEFGLGNLLLAQGQLDAAIEHLTEAVRLQPRAIDARAKLGVAQAARGNAKEALLQYREALRLQPNQADVLNNLAWMLATHPVAEFRSGVEAVSLAERACELTRHEQPVFVGTLAAAYAEAGQFDKAVEAARKASSLAEAGGQKELAVRNRQLLELYQQGRPFREER